MKREQETVYVLHGWSVRSGNLNQNKWKPFIDQLKVSRVSVVFLKIPGLSAPLTEVWDLDNFVSWLGEELKQHSNNKKVTLLGHSFGGQIAIRFTAQNPELVSKLILLDSAGIRDMSLKAVIKRTVFLVLSKIGKLFFQSEFFRNILYKLAREQDYKNAPPLLRRTMSKILDDEVLDDLPKIQCATQIIWGKNDLVTPIRHAQQMKDTIPKSELVYIEGARHSPQFTHPKETAEIVVEFVRGL